MHVRFWVLNPRFHICYALDGVCKFINVVGTWAMGVSCFGLGCEVSGPRRKTFSSTPCTSLGILNNRLIGDD
jgi:hypothetical protein